jgi:serine phosphatase RsbU (regulator of sigma subunit)
MQMAAATGADVVNYEMDAVLPSGRRITVFGNASPLLDDQGRVRGSLAAYMDITERKKVEAEREHFLDLQRELNDRLTAANEELIAQGEQLSESYRRQTQLALDQQLLFERLQRVFLDSLPEIPNVRFAYDHLSATLGTQIGGDFYDLFLIRDNYVGLMVGDVSGQGIEASRIALMVKDSLTTYAMEEVPPAEVLERVNTLLVRKGTPGFVTAFLAYLDLGTGELHYSSAGHPPPLLSVPGSTQPLDTNPAAPLGAFPDTRYATDVIRLPQTGTLLLYTDGVTETRRNGSFYGEDRLAQSLGRARSMPLAQLPGLLFEDVMQFADGAISDDAAILAIEYGDPSRERRPG